MQLLKTNDHTNPSHALDSPSPLTGDILREGSHGGLQPLLTGLGENADPAARLHALREQRPAESLCPGGELHVGRPLVVAQHKLTGGEESAGQVKPSETARADTANTSWR